MPLIVDKYGRTFKTLRVSLLSRCNLGCVYCVSGDELPASQAGDGLSYSQNFSGQGVLPHSYEFAREGTQAPPAAPVQPLAQDVPRRALSVTELLGIIRRLHEQLGFHTIRLTGGEPLLYRELVDVIAGIHAMGVPEIKLTTNGVLLKKLAAPMKAAGMVSVNVSLDAIDEAVFFRMSRRRSVQRVVDGIDAALEAGLEVKINTVVMKGINDGQVLPLLDFAFSRGLRIRFLELMGMGYLHDRSQGYLFSQQEILSVIAGRYGFQALGRADSATASYWKTDEGHVFGVIANESEPFCRDCDRLRLDSEGNIYGCLSSNHPIALDSSDTGAAWNDKLQTALMQKQALRFTGSELSMLHIGG